MTATAEPAGLFGDTVPSGRELAAREAATEIADNDALELADVHGLIQAAERGGDHESAAVLRRALELLAADRHPITFQAPAA